jgi:hypothetical protein
MKRIGLLTLTIIFFVTLLQAQNKKVKEEMVFDKIVEGSVLHDFGSIVYGANGNVDFVYTNKGASPLVISDVKSTCGCTVPSWTKEPVAPGQKGTIQVKYNTALPGAFNKTIVVYSNANNSPVRVSIKGKVNPQASDLKPGMKKETTPGVETVQTGEDANQGNKPQVSTVKGSQKDSVNKPVKPKPVVQKPGAPKTAPAAPKQAGGEAVKK